jgi:hypothetical protein
MADKAHDVNLVGARKNIYHFAGDISREYMFSINLPAIFGKQSLSTMTVFCQSSRIPEFKLVNKALPFQKLHINLVDGITFVPWSPTFLSDDSNIIRSNLLTWSSVAWDFNRKGSATPSSYKRQIEVQQLNRLGVPVCKYILEGAYPEVVGGYSLDNTSKHLVKFDTTFHYDYFTFESYANYPYDRTIQEKMSDTTVVSNGASTQPIG